MIIVDAEMLKVINYFRTCKDARDIHSFDDIDQARKFAEEMREKLEGRPLFKVEQRNSRVIISMRQIINPEPSF